MNNNDFQKIISTKIEEIKSLLITKGAEYAPGSDRLHNFRQAAHIQGISMKEALAGMMTKHVVSIYDMTGSSKTFTREQWNEKIGDNIVYLLLLLCTVEEENGHIWGANPTEDEIALERLKQQLGGAKDEDEGGLADAG